MNENLTFFALSETTFVNTNCLALAIYVVAQHLCLLSNQVPLMYLLVNNSMS